MSDIYKIRRFQTGDAEEVSALIAKTLRTVNIKDYSRIVGCGAIAGYWGSKTESILLTIFVLPEYQGKGIGKLIIRTLEQDEFFLRAERIEIPASITAVDFYRKMGYDYKNGIAEIDDEQVYRLEKFR